MATKTKHAKLVSCEQRPAHILGEEETWWVAKDSAGRSFIGATKEEAEKMLAEYNHLKEG
jgi:hypothetical protein